MDNGLILQALAFIGGLFGVWINLSNKVKELEIRVQQMEGSNKQIIEKLDQIFIITTNIRIDLQNKQDRI
jgi:outer membrane lipoprotein SlyB